MNLEFFEPEFMPNWAKAIQNMREKIKTKDRERIMNKY
jgi:hypothetical protein